MIERRPGESVEDFQWRTIVAKYDKEPEEVKMQKMEGVIAQLQTFAPGPGGKVINSEIVFRPQCDWYMPDLHDHLGVTGYHDIGAVIDEFGIDVAEKIVEGEIVPVVREVEEDKYQLTSCKAEKKEFEIVSSTIRYPIPDSVKEYLVVKRSK